MGINRIAPTVSTGVAITTIPVQTTQPLTATTTTWTTTTPTNGFRVAL